MARHKPTQDGFRRRVERLLQTGAPIGLLDHADASRAAAELLYGAPGQPLCLPLLVPRKLSARGRHTLQPYPSHQPETRNPDPNHYPDPNPDPDPDPNLTLTLTLTPNQVADESQLVYRGHTAPIDCVAQLAANAFVSGSQDVGRTGARTLDDHARLLGGCGSDRAT